MLYIKSTVQLTKAEVNPTAMLVQRSMTNAILNINKPQPSK